MLQIFCINIYYIFMIYANYTIYSIMNKKFKKISTNIDVSLLQNSMRSKTILHRMILIQEMINSGSGFMF